MKAMRCELCGSTEIIKDGDFFVCQSCGMKYTLENARNMMVEVEGVVEVKGTVKQDRSEELLRLLELARGGIDSSNFKDAESYAMRALEIDLNNGKAWAIKAEAIDWQMTLADNRAAESAQARLEMYKQLRNTSDNISDILDTTQVIAKHSIHIKKIVDAETSLFTGPLKSNPNNKSAGYISTLVKHVEFRETEYKSIQTLAKLWKAEAEKALEHPENLKPAEENALREAIDLLGKIIDVTPSTIANMYCDIADKLNSAQVKGYSDATNQWWEKYPNLAVNGSESAKKAAFEQYTDACDACADTLRNAIKLVLSEAVSATKGAEELADTLYLYYKNISVVEYQCIDHSFPGSWHFADKAKSIRNKELAEYQRLRDSYDPEIKKQKLEKARNEAIERKMQQMEPELWNQSQQKIDIEAAKAKMNSLQESLKSKKAQLNNLGLFKFKEKSSLEEEISKLKKDMEAQDAIIAKASSSFEAELREKATEQIDSESSQESDSSAE